MIKKLRYFLLLLSFFTSFSQSPNLSKDAVVSVLTCGKGNELYTVFGHTAIRIKDSINNLDVVYNYGAFDFRVENFYLKFVKGDLQYFMNASSFEEFIYEYQQENREVIQQNLNFSTVKKQQLFDKLNASLFSDERNYTYKFIDRNCTTMVVEKINETVGKKIIQKVDDTSISYRKVLYPYFQNHFWYKLGINIIFGFKTDKNATQLFLPVELLHSLNKSKVDGETLVTETEILLNAKTSEDEFSFFNSIYFVALLLLILVLVNNKTLIFSYLFILGLLGLFFSLVGFYSFHKELLWNYNVLLFNPIYLILPFISNLKWRKNCIIATLILLVIYVILMLYKPHLVLVVPFILANFYILWRLQFKKKLF